MEVKVNVECWRVEEDKEKEKKKITGTYTIKCGDLEVARQNFNTEFQGIKLPFSKELLSEVEQVSNKIITEITNHFAKG